MLNKEEILKGLKSSNISLKESVYQYACRFQSYDDANINAEFINNLDLSLISNINYDLQYSKLNEKILKRLLEMHTESNLKSTKIYIEDIALNHYPMLKKLDINLDNTLIDTDNILFYKKLKHFEKKDASQLIQLYIDRLENLIDADDNTDNSVSQTMLKSIGIALIQTKQGQELFQNFVVNTFAKHSDSSADFYGSYMPYFTDILFQIEDINPYCLEFISNFYILLDDDSFDYYEDMISYYLVTVCKQEKMEEIIKSIKTMPKYLYRDKMYTIGVYINSSNVDNLLINTFKNTNKRSTKETILGVMALRFNKEIIPMAIDFIEKYKIPEDSELAEKLAPLLIIADCKDTTSTRIIEAVNNNSIDLEEEFAYFKTQALSNLTNLLVKGKTHIKRYKKIRTLYEEIRQNIMDYWADGKIKCELAYPENKHHVAFMERIFDFDSDFGISALTNLLYYKNFDGQSTLVEDFIHKNRYRNADKKEMLQNMQNSQAGLYEITNIDISNAQLTFKNLFTNDELCLTDISLSANNYGRNDLYFYTRIISHEGINFTSEMVIPFRKDDEFIQNWIKENSRNYAEKDEASRFLELYSRYVANNNNTIMNKYEAFNN